MLMCLFNIHLTTQLYHSGSCYFSLFFSTSLCFVYPAQPSPVKADDCSLKSCLHNIVSRRCISLALEGFS